MRKPSLYSEVDLLLDRLFQIKEELNREVFDLLKGGGQIDESFYHCSVSLDQFNFSIASAPLAIFVDTVKKQ